MTPAQHIAQRERVRQSLNAHRHPDVFPARKSRFVTCPECGGFGERMVNTSPSGRDPECWVPAGVCPRCNGECEVLA